MDLSVYLYLQYWHTGMHVCEGSNGAINVNEPCESMETYLF